MIIVIFRTGRRGVKLSLENSYFRLQEVSLKCCPGRGSDFIDSDKLKTRHIAYFDILKNRVGVTHKCVRQTDGKTTVEAVVVVYLFQDEALPMG